MDRIAVFVDAGYLFAQGSVALTGDRVSRDRLTLNHIAIVERLTLLATETSSLPLLRIYWYDGIPPYRGPGAQQLSLAQSDNVKARFGFINNAGQQKGVDSLIVTDLIELARNRAISDALLLSGDEDTRIGVQVAQSFGVRVHLVGIRHDHGSQSPQLMQEADTTVIWDRAAVESFLAIAPESAEAAATAPGVDTNEGALLELVEGVVSSLNEGSRLAVQTFWETQRGVPPDFDRTLIGKLHGLLDRPPEEHEKRFVRMKFRELVETGARIGNAQPSSPPRASDA